MIDHTSSIKHAKKSMMGRHLNMASEHSQEAIFLNPDRAEIFNMLRVIIKIQGDHIGAQTNYQSTVSLDPFKQDGSRQEISVSVRKSLYGITTPIHGIGIP